MINLMAKRMLSVKLIICYFYNDILVILFHLPQNVDVLFTLRHSVCTRKHNGFCLAW